MFQRVLVIGGTGKTGARVCTLLSQLNVEVVAPSRRSEQAFDWQQRDTWAQVMVGVEAIYLTYYPDLAVPSAPADIQYFCDLAVKAGVKHITLLSGRGEPAAQLCENIVMNSGLSWTVVRASWFNQNFSEGLFTQFIRQGNIALPVGDMTEPFVDVQDIAEVVVASLTREQHGGKLYEVTGPELLSFAHIADLFSQQLGKTVTFTSIDFPTFKQNLQAWQVEPGAIGMLEYLFGEVLDGRNAYICDGVERALGRKPTRFREFIRANFVAAQEREHAAFHC